MSTEHARNQILNGSITVFELGLTKIGVFSGKKIVSKTNCGVQIFPTVYGLRAVAAH